VHRGVVVPFLTLQAEARESGFDLRILSGFRDFDHQRSIWNRKARGDLPVLDSDAAPLDVRKLDDLELTFAILRWSALPGGSRHHWGTDLDVYDARACPEGYEIGLVPEEVEGDGMFAPLHDWLDGRIAAGASHGFFRPYDRDRSGVAPERWHLSHAPVAADFERALTRDVLHDAIVDAEVELKLVVLAKLGEIHERFVTNVNPIRP